MKTMTIEELYTALGEMLAKGQLPYTPVRVRGAHNGRSPCIELRRGSCGNEILIVVDEQDD
jgi:hypothetical protein